MDNENKYNNFDEETVLDQGIKTSTANNGETEASNGEPTDEKKKKEASWKKVAMGAGAGIILGAGGTVIMGSSLSHGEDQLPDDVQTEGYTPLFDSEITMATSVNDDMSFADAFDAAREELGPGGVFVWHGNIYSTYTPDEWDNMSPEEQAEYEGHFSWSQDLPDDSVEEVQANFVDYGVSVATCVSDDMSFSEAFAAAREEVGPGGVFEWHGHLYNTYLAEEWNSMSAEDRTEFANNISGATAATDDPIQLAGADVQVEYEPEVEVLGVEHDYETGMNIGAVVIDGQEVILADVTGDGMFNLAAVDVNEDGYIQDNEIQDISGAGLTVDDLGGIDNPVLYASNMDSGDDPDFTNDADVSSYMA